MQTPENTPRARQNTPENQPQGQDTTPEFIQKSDDVRRLMGDKVPETAAVEWKGLMDLALSVPVHPSDAPEALNALQREELARRYERIRDYRANTLLGLQAAAAAVTQRNPARLSENEQDTVLRLLAQYVRERRLYDQLIAEDTVLDVNLPSYLAVYVQLEQQERFSLAATDRLLQIQYDVLDQANEELPDTEKIPVDPDALAPYASQILRRAIRRDLTISHLRPCLQNTGVPRSADQPFIDFLQTAGYQPADIQQHDIHAAKMLVGFLSKYLPKTEELARVRGVDVNQMQLNTITESMAFSSVLNSIVDGLAHQGVDILQGEPPDLRAIAHSVLEQTDPFTGAANEVVLGSLVLDENATPEERQALQEHVTSAATFMMSGDGAAVYLNELQQDNTSTEGILHLKDTEKQIIVALAQKVQTPEFADALASITDLTESNALLYMRHGDWRKDVQDTLRSMLADGTLSLRDAYQLYYLSETSGMKSLPVAFKVVDILDKNENSNLADLFQHGIIRRLMGLLDVRDINVAIEKIGLEGEAANVARHFEEKWEGLVPGIIEEFVQWHENYPLYAFGLDALAIPAAYKGYIAIRMWRAERFATMDPIEAVRRYHPEAIADPDLYRTALQRVQTAQQEINTLLNKYRRLSIMHLDRGMRLRGRTLAVLRTRSATELADIAKSIKGKYGSVENVAEYLARMAPDEDALRTALQAAGYNAEQVDNAFNYLRAADAFEFDDLLDAVANPLARANQLASETTLLPGDRRRLAQELVGDGLDDGITLSNAVDDVHSFKNAELREAYAALDAAEDAGTGVREARRRVQSILIEKRNRLMQEWNLPKSKANALVRSGICGLDDTARVMELVEAVDPKVTARLAETATNIVPRTLDELRTAVRGAHTYDDALELIRGYHGQATELHVARYIDLLEDEHLVQLARTARRADQLHDMQEATRMASRAAQRARLLRTGGVVAGVGLTAFGVFVDGYMMYVTNQRIQDARKRGDTAEAHILESKWYSEAGEAGFGVVTGGLGLAGVLSGPPGWVALGGLAIKSVTSEYLYNYALDLNQTGTAQYLRLPEDQQMALVRGQGDWLIDSGRVRNFRHESALDAYVQSTHLVGLNRLDLQYIQDVLMLMPDWQQEDVTKPETLQRMAMNVLQEKNGYQTKDFRDFMRAAAAVDSPTATQIELGLYYAELKHVERRAGQLGQPELFNQTLAGLGVEPLQDMLQPTDILERHTQTRTTGGRNRNRTTTVTYTETPLARAMRKEKIQGLYYQLVLLKTMVSENEMSSQEAKITFMSMASTILFTHDINIFTSGVADQSKFDRFKHDETVSQIMYHELGDVYTFADYDHPERFINIVQKLQTNVRAFMAKQESFSLRQLDPNDSYFGPLAYRPVWYLQDPFDMRERGR